MVQVGGVGETTNNLFDISAITIRKYIDASGAEKNSTAEYPENYLNHSDYINISPSQNYTFKCVMPSRYTLANTIAFCWFDINKNIISRNTLNINQPIDNYVMSSTSPENATYLIINFIGLVDGAKFSLNVGSTSLPYEPFGYKVPVVINGKNLLQNNATSQTKNGVTFTVNEDGSVTCNGTNHGNDTIIFELNYPGVVLPEGVYITSGCPAGGSQLGGYKIQYNNGSSWYYELGSGNTFTLSGSLNYRSRILISTNVTVTNLTFYPMLRKADITDDTYEPYIEPTTTNIYLDEPIGANESISLSDTNTNIPTIRGTNILTVDTQVQPSNVYVKARKESQYETIMRERYEEAQAQLDALES